jgi:NodT family efflux transporter outer membrane factor (OMF) lipoprotein
MSDVARRHVWLCALVCCVAGCSNTALPELEPDDVPQAWTGPGDVDTIWPPLNWWDEFQTDELARIIADVQASNATLKNNERNLRAAEILLTEAGFDLYPTPILSFTAVLNYQGADVSDADYFDRGTESYGIGADLVYADILSKRDRYDLARAQYDASVARAADTALNTLATAASTYFRVLLARDRIATARQNLENAIVISDILQARFEAGVINEIDALQQEIAVEQQRNAVRNFVQNELAARASLAVLMNRSVRDFDIEGESLEAVAVPSVAPGLPAELLIRRPDLVQAEANLRAARANVDLARAAFLPDISLTASADASSNDLVRLIEQPDLFVNAAASLAQTIVDNGRRSRSVELNRLDLESQFDDYRNTVIRAFNEIDVALSNIELLNSLAQVALEDRSRAEESFRIAEVRYREGVTDYQRVLNAQTALYQARTRYLDNKLARLNAIVAFYQSLGGGWVFEPQS